MSRPPALGFKHVLTPQEACLWIQLKAMRKQGYHWRKQHTWSRFVLDFVCLTYALVVEVDGGHHNEERQADHDLMRDNILARSGFLTLRFSNREVDRGIDHVLGTISDALRTRAPTRSARLRLPDHPPASGRDLPPRDPAS